jgi:hypothetical protein
MWLIIEYIALQSSQWCRLQTNKFRSKIQNGFKICQIDCAEWCHSAHCLTDSRIISSHIVGDAISGQEISPTGRRAYIKGALHPIPGIATWTNFDRAS